MCKIVIDMIDEGLTLFIRQEKRPTGILDHKVEEGNAFDVEFRIIKDALQCCLSLHAVGLQVSCESEVDVFE